MGRIGRALAALSLVSLLGGAEAHAAADAGSAARARVMTVGLPLFMDEVPLQEVIIRLAGFDPEPSVEIDSLRRALEPAIKPDMLARLDGLAVEDGFVSIDALAGVDIDIAYDAAALRLVYTPEVDATARRSISLRTRPRTTAMVPNTVPAALSGFVNFRNTTRFRHDASDLSLRTGLDGAMRIGPVVLEGSGAFDTDTGFRRLDTRAVYDMPEMSSRISAGDIFIERTGFQSGGALGGILFDKTLAAEQTGTTRSTGGSRSFQLERRSTVEIYVNDRLRRRTTLEAGEYTIDDLGLSNARNTVRIWAEDADGRITEQSFTVFFDSRLLAVGEIDYAASLGVESRAQGRGRDYDTDRVVGSAFYRRGITDRLTLSANGQADRDGAMIGGDLLAATPVGALALDIAASHSREAGAGYAVDIDLAIDGPENSGTGGSADRLSLSLSHYSDGFFRAGQGPDPTNPVAWAANAAWSRELDARTGFSLSGGYEFLREGDDRGFAQLGVFHQLGPDVSLRGGIGYESGEDSVFGFFGLVYRFSGDGVAIANYDTRNNTIGLGATYSQGEYIGALNGGLSIRHSDDGAAVDGDISYTGNRYTASLAHSSGGDGLSGIMDTQVTSARVDTAIAFAGGVVAVGRPVGGSFALLDTHASLAESEVVISDLDERQRAAADGLGPVIYPVSDSYRTTPIAYDIEPRPIGYADDEGVFRIQPGYRAGYRLTVGSDYHVTAIGTALDVQGEPIGGLVGIAREVDGKGGEGDGREVDLFTNGAGRFAAQGLRPGAWEVILPTNPETRLRLDIPQTDESFIRLGEIRP